MKPDLNTLIRDKIRGMTVGHITFQPQTREDQTPRDMQEALVRVETRLAEVTAELRRLCERLERPEPAVTPPLDLDAPEMLNDKELKQILGYSHATFYRYKRMGEFKRFESINPIGPRRYSRWRVDQYRNGANRKKTKPT